MGPLIPTDVMDLRTLAATREELTKWNGRPSDRHCELKSTVVNANLDDNVRARASIVNSENEKRRLSAVKRRCADAGGRISQA